MHPQPADEIPLIEILQPSVQAWNIAGRSGLRVTEPSVRIVFACVCVCVRARPCVYSDVQCCRASNGMFSLLGNIRRNNEDKSREVTLFSPQYTLASSIRAHNYENGPNRKINLSHILRCIHKIYDLKAKNTCLRKYDLDHFHDIEHKYKYLVIIISLVNI